MKIFSNFLHHYNPASGWPYRFRSSGSTWPSKFDHLAIRVVEYVSECLDTLTSEFWAVTSSLPFYLILRRHSVGVTKFIDPGCGYAVGEPLSSEGASCLLFDKELCTVGFRFKRKKWLQENIDRSMMFNRWWRWFHSSRVKLPLVSMSASGFLVSSYLIRILGTMSWVSCASILLSGICFQTQDKSLSVCSSVNLTLLSHIPYIESEKTIHSQSRIQWDTFRFCGTVRYQCLLLAHTNWWWQMYDFQRCPNRLSLLALSSQSLQQKLCLGMDPIDKAVLHFPRDYVDCRFLYDDCVRSVLPIFCRKLVSTLWLILQICSLTMDFSGLPIRATILWANFWYFSNWIKFLFLDVIDHPGKNL